MCLRSSNSICAQCLPDLQIELRFRLYAQLAVKKIVRQVRKEWKVTHDPEAERCRMVNNSNVSQVPSDMALKLLYGEKHLDPLKTFEELGVASGSVLTGVIFASVK